VMRETMHECKMKNVKCKTQNYGRAPAFFIFHFTFYIFHSLIRFRLVPLCCIAALGPTATANARTIELTDYDCDRMAVLSPQAPLSGWATSEVSPGEFSTVQLDLRIERAMLLRYPLDRIPTGQRITRAEWVVPIALSIPAGPQRMLVRRIIGPWGVGVSHQFRMQRPKQVPWTTPGAASAGADRAAQPSAIARCDGPGEVTINVTEDVELWYTGAAENQGWLLSVEDPAALIRLNSPFWTGHGNYKLRITYEPE